MEKQENGFYSGYKHNWQEFKNVLLKYGIATLYHFTDSSNLESINKNGGLYSWAYCQRNGIDIFRPGGNDLSRNLDVQKGLQNYVRVSFVSDHPMIYVAQRHDRILSPVIMEISVEVIFMEKTIFTVQNASRKGVTASGSIEAFQLIDFPLFKKQYFELSDDEKPYYQAEILVYEHIPLEFICISENW
ncbi:MAG: DUF4433 domain-containing protein [Dysgonamonadaceae bacterium]|nr:DUF4433 domain-containing protein [Dysgonamonadaceae bacterium]